MDKDGKAVIRYFWLVACVASFALPLFLTPAPENMWHWLLASMGEMLFAMVLLSFPCSLLFLLGVALLFFFGDPFEPSVASYVLLWLGLLMTGYVQWFWLVPRIFGKRNLITLDLAQGKVAVPFKKRRKRARRARLDVAPVAPFDRQGRTPLERIIGQR